MKKFRIDSQYRVMNLFIVNFHFSIGRAAMNAPRYWELHDDACELHELRDETSADTQRLSYPNVFIAATPLGLEAF
jgi:hypothetical protein